MILPHPESDLSTNIMVLGIEIIKLMKRRDFVLVEDVLCGFINGASKRTPEMFLNTLVFLYSFDLIEKRGYKIKLKMHENNIAGTN